MTKIIWLGHGATAAMRQGAFPAADDALDEGGSARVASLNTRHLRHDRAVISSSRAAIETARLLGLKVSHEPAIDDLGLGRWANMPFDEVYAREAESMAAWLADPTITAPEGEPLTDAIQRVTAWIEAQQEADVRILAIAQPMIIRIAIAHALQCPLLSACNIDIAPLSRTTISFNRKWRLQELNSADG